MIQRSQVGRHDLLRCLRAWPGAPPALLARLCDLLPAEAGPSEVRAPTGEPVALPTPVPLPPPGRAPAAPRLELLLPVKARALDPAPEDRDRPQLQCEILLEANRQITDAELSAVDRPLPATPPLQPWARLWPYARHALGCRRDSRRLDTRPLMRQLAAYRPITRLPCLRYPGWAERISLLWDRRPDLLPFWDDMEGVLDRVRQQHGSEGLEVIRLDSGAPPKELPRSGGPVLVLGDLGCLAGDTTLIQGWWEYGRRLRRAGVRPSVLAPCPRSRWDTDLTRVWRCAGWDRGLRLPRGERGLRPLRAVPEAERERRVERLLTLLSSALRVEPGLLRAVRLLLPSSQADVGTEYDAWNHPHAVNDADAMGVRAAQAVTLRKGLQHALSLEGQAALANLLERWHERCAETIRTAETLLLDEAGAPVPAAAVDLARTLQNRAAAALLDLARAGRRSEVMAQGLAAWQQRGLARFAPAARQTEEFLTVGWAVLRWLNGAPRAKVPEGLNAGFLAQVLHSLEADPGRETLWEVRQLGYEVIVQPWEPGVSSSLAFGAPLAWLRARRSRFRLDVTEASGRSAGFDFVSRGAAPLRHFIGHPRRLVLSSDCGEIELEARTRQPWARRFGRDRFGVYTEFDIKGVAFCLRWIPPGSFLMGSPEFETGRDSDEGPEHQVTLSHGFWLANTHCTQEQWKAVMGDNPSYFTKPNEPRRPVESVNWEQCKQFCKRLREQVPDFNPDLEFRLPTEAEWEYACRAGTTSAFSDGSPCTVPEGKDPALEKLGWHGEGGNGRTHPVGEKLANAWGLYDMHGNVWEWCLDGKRDYRTESQNFVGPLEETAWRVVRGGSLWSSAWVCRSAYRFTDGPGDRGRGLGFRLAAGQPPAQPAGGRGALGQAAGGAAAPGPEAPAARPASGASRRPKKNK